MASLVMSQLTLLRLGWFERRNPWLQLTLSGLLAALVFSPVGVSIDIWLAGEALEAGWVRETLDEFSGVAPPAMLCWLAINAPWIWGFRIEREDAPARETPAEAPRETATGDATPQPRFFHLLPAELRDAVIYLQAELHYISVVTRRGRGLILYNLKDAISELEALGLAGLQCHRSFWVASEFIEALEKQGRQGQLRLTNGDRVPVSRRNMDEIKARLGS
jgi:hypothetical protein